MYIPPDHYLLFRSSPYPYLVMAPDLTIIDANDAYLRSVQRTKEQIVGLNVFEAFPENPNDTESTNIQEVKASLETAMATKKPHTTPFLRYSVPVDIGGETVFQERFWNAVHTPALRDDGSVAFVYQNAIDVTELYKFDRRTQSASVELGPTARNRTEDFNRAQMHEAMARVLNDERGHLRNLFNQAPGFVAVLTGSEYVFEVANEAYYQLVGHRELIGRPLWEALPEVRGQGFEEKLSHVYTTGQAWKTSGMRLMVQREAGGPTEERFIDLSYQPYRAKDGAIIGIFAQGYDVTEAHAARQAERESAERLSEGLLAAKMVVWDWDLVSDQLYMSDNASHVLGLQSTDRELVDSHIHPEDQAVMKAKRSRALADQSHFEVTVRFARPDNHETIWIDVRGRVRIDATGAPFAVRGIVLDISERMHAEEELRKADRRKDEFLAMLAHELRNPLAPISTAAEVLRFGSTNPERVRTTSEIISRQVKHMTNLIDDLLDVSRVTRGLIELDLESLDIESVVASAIEQAKPLLDARGHALSLRMGNIKAMVQGDRTRLVQTISNLLNNAVKYTPQGGAIEVAVEVNDATVHIIVQDNGIGIEASLLPHLFDLFTQGMRTSDRAQGGLGLGLALVKSILQMHGGQIEARSAGTDMGSTFTMSLPCTVQAAPFNEQQALHAPQPLAPLRILVVDDNLDGGQMLATLLQAYGHDVLVASDGPEGLKLATAHQVDVCILDIGLPGMNGYELARHIRTTPASGQAVLIALTGYSQAHDRVLSKGAGFAQHLVKPVVLAELEQALRAVPRTMLATEYAG